MANLIIKPTSGGSLILQDEGGDAALTVGTTGSTTLAGTANNLGTVTAATIASGVHGKYTLEEFDHFLYATQTETTTTNTDTLNVSGSSYVTVTPGATTDIVEFSFFTGVYIVDSGYAGMVFQRSTATSFDAGLTGVMRTGRYTWGAGTNNDNYWPLGGTITKTASDWGMSAGTAYYWRMAGQTHSVASTFRWNPNGTGDTGKGVFFSVKRYKVI